MRHPRLALSAIPAIALLLVACGTTPATTGLSTGSSTGFDALATQTLREGFTNIHMAIFTKIDANGDGYIDEYEAGPYFDLVHEFPAASHHHDRISKAEFMAYATQGGFLTPRDTPSRFVDRMRSFLATTFDRLDQKRTRLLTPDELSDKALVKLGLGFAYPRLHVSVSIDTLDPADIKAADHTGDGLLSQAEFEDLYINEVVKAINPNYHPDPSPAPSSKPSPKPSTAPASASV
jgi:hypothetical protein